MLRQVLRVEADELGEEQGEQRPGIGQPVRRDAHVDRHALAAQLAQVEVVGAGGGIDHRIRKDRQRRVKGGHHAGERVLRVAQQALQSIQTFFGERFAGFLALLDQPTEVFFQRAPLPEDWRSISPTVRGRSGVSSNSRPRPRKRLRAWSLKKASDEVPLPSLG